MRNKYVVKQPNNFYAVYDKTKKTFICYNLSKEQMIGYLYKNWFLHFGQANTLINEAFGYGENRWKVLREEYIRSMSRKGIIYKQAGEELIVEMSSEFVAE